MRVKRLYLCAAAVAEGPENGYEDGQSSGALPL